MSAPALAQKADAIFAAHAQKDVLRFITCGSVDDGKSTLIGRLLHDSHQLLDDQLITLKRDSKRSGSAQEGVDYSLLVDGLAAEREQGITIDVAYRFFSTEKRSFIVADTPGHEQYTRNMATAASTAELAVLLVDARKGLTRQTRRHSLLVSLLGVRRIVLAINKMDLIGWSETAYAKLMEDYRAFAEPLGFAEIQGIPLSALNGDNVVAPAVAASWYEGPTLMHFLENVAVEASLDAAFRLPVQRVVRHKDGARGYAGMVAAGSIAVGDTVGILPSGGRSVVTRISTFDGDLPRAERGQSITLSVVDEFDISRGDILSDPANAPRVAETLTARVFWVAETALEPGARLNVKVGTVSGAAIVEDIVSTIDLETLTANPATVLERNAIGDVRLAFDRSIAFDAYKNNRDTGSLILIDPATHDTVGMALIQNV
ncbi:sulfate adenylyltransferase subunit 1 [Variibacter gotjawalensis]|uniref:Bifunctional enzyme NodQ n=1 Tax=Variibacter gotjawalensis TaxID=1333996 RepID=A0A0S3PQU1_9BRAD|nr:sulfate adenylyltransferase subunit 1 [Variibacter gotjawalensis]RZS50469.1 sulfate adenylyltransferase subunit 1 [Variibacter gotjawalensis]BAT58303.1 sulfate adenylyltransferase subunit 1 [Variibacter gotjawalensis]